MVRVNDPEFEKKVYNSYKEANWISRVAKELKSSNTRVLHYTKILLEKKYIKVTEDIKRKKGNSYIIIYKQV